MTQSKPKLDSLVQDALQTFWLIIARHYPEATTGDLSVEQTTRLTAAAENAVKEWIDINVPSSSNTAIVGTAAVTKLLAYLDHNCALLVEFGCSVAISEDGKAIFTCPTLADGSAERYPFDARFMNWGEVTAPEQGFLQMVNATFDTSFRYEDFAGR